VLIRKKLTELGLSKDSTPASISTVVALKEVVVFAPCSVRLSETL